MNRVLGLAVLVALTLALAGCEEDNALRPEQPNVVKMTSALRFEPAEITIQAGETVHWKNASLTAQTVTADPAQAKKPGDVALPRGAKPFNSGRLEPGQGFDYTFALPGVYKYFCVPHESMGMLGTVVVRSAGEGGMKPPDGGMQPAPEYQPKRRF